MASATLPGQRGGGGLQSPARDHEAELWRAHVVVHLPDRAPRRRSAATGSEALPPIRQQLFWESRSLRIDLQVVPGEWKIGLTATFGSSTATAIVSNSQSPPEAMQFKQAPSPFPRRASQP